eukprot:scaffold50658_cov63-Phaeocystis_antarctica.AAC.2
MTPRCPRHSSPHEEHRGNVPGSQRSESDRRQAGAHGGQVRRLRPAIRSRVVDFRRAETPPTGVPAEDVELATHRCGGMVPPSDAHAASQLCPCVGLRVVHEDRAQRVTTSIDLATSHIDPATHRGGCVPRPTLRHAGHPLPAVGLRVVDLHRVVRDHTVIATHDVDLAVKHHRGMEPALLTHTRHQSPRAELRIVGLNQIQCQAATYSTDRVDLATKRGQPQRIAYSAHLGQRLPAIGLRVVHLRRVDRLTCGSMAAHDVELTIESDAAM